MSLAGASVRPFQLWRNNKTGDQYAVIDVCEDATSSRAGEQVVIYCRADINGAKHWALDLSEFAQEFVRVES